MKNRRAEFNHRVQTLVEAEETLNAIRTGCVDAFVVQEPEGHRVYTLEGADLPYSILVERMEQGAAILNAHGEIVYCNVSLADLLGIPAASTIGFPLQNFILQSDQASYQTLLREAEVGASEGEMSLLRSDGTPVVAKLFFRFLSRDKSAFGVLISDLTIQKQQEKLAVHLQQMQDEERRRIARELHDSVGQLASAIAMNVAKVSTEAHKLSPEAAQAVQENAGLIEEINNEIRTISHLLHPPLLDEVGLTSAIRWYVDGFSQRSKIETVFVVSASFPRLSQEMEIAIFRAVQECLTNVHRHSGSSTCTVVMADDGEQIRVQVKDSGRGIPLGKQSSLPSSGGVGLRGMQERIRQLEGRLDINSSEGGTIVTVTLPIRRASPGAA
jgi:signal transduction histidine kinase